MGTDWYGTIHLCIHAPEEWWESLENQEVDYRSEELEELAERIQAFAEDLLPDDWHAVTHWAA